MAGLKFGSVTPGTGDIKVGSSNASKIYQGSTLLWPLGVEPQPGEVTICDLVWTKTNSTITADTTGSAILVTTDATGWGQAIENQQPAACWYKNDPLTYGHLGLFYNKFCLDVLQPPTGFRLPTQTDWTELRDCLASGKPQVTYANQIVNNYYNLWPSGVNSLSDINTVDFNSIASAFMQGGKSTGGNYFQTFFNNPGSFYWHSDQNLTTNPRRALGMIHAYNSYYNYVYLNYLNSTTDDSLPYNSNGFNIRFVKDAPPPATVNFYFNDTQTGTPTTSVYQDAFAAGNTQGTSAVFKTSNISFEVIGSPATIKFVAYTDTGTAQPPLARFAAIDWRIYNSVDRLSHQLVHQTYWNNNSAGSDSFPIIPSTPSSTLGFSIENWGTEPGSVTLNPGVYYAWLAYTYGNSSISGGNVDSNYRASFEVGP